MARPHDASRGQGTDPSKIAGEREIAEELRDGLDIDDSESVAEMLDMTEDEVEEFFDGGISEEE